MGISGFSRTWVISLNEHVYLSKEARFLVLEIIRIHHECEGGIEKTRPEDHRLVSRGLPIDNKR